MGYLGEVEFDTVEDLTGARELRLDRIFERGDVERGDVERMEVMTTKQSPIDVHVYMLHNYPYSIHPIHNTQTTNTITLNTHQYTMKYTNNIQHLNQPTLATN